MTDTKLTYGYCSSQIFLIILQHAVCVAYTVQMVDKFWLNQSWVLFLLQAISEEPTPVSTIKSKFSELRANAWISQGI